MGIYSGKMEYGYRDRAIFESSEKFMAFNGIVDYKSSLRPFFQ